MIDCIGKNTYTKHSFYRRRKIMKSVLFALVSAAALAACGKKEESKK